MPDPGLTLNLIPEQVPEKFAQENLRRLQTFFGKHPLLAGSFVGRTIVFSGAVTNFKYAHGLAFVPIDVLLMSKTGTGALTINYGNFDSTNLDFTTTGACTVRLLIGKMGGVL